MFAGARVVVGSTVSARNHTVISISDITTELDIQERERAGRGHQSFGF
jgi:hypothetical protein